MNIVFNESDFGSPTLPKVLIDSVMLTHGAIGVINPKQDPHIAHDDELQAINIIELKNFNEEEFGEMAVKLDLRFMYPIENDFGSANALFNSELINHVDFTVVQCRSKPIGDNISKDPNKYLNPYTGIYRPSVNPDVGAQIKSQLQFKSRDAGLSLSTQYATPYALISDELSKETMTAGGYADLGVSTTLPFEKITTNDGKQYYSIPFTMDFTIPASAGGTSPHHLSYFAFCSINKESILQSQTNPGNIQILDDSFGVTVSNDVMGKIGMGETFYDIIIDNRKVYDKSYYYRDNNGSIYVGPVHQMLNGQWMKGASHSDLEGPSSGYESKGYYLTQVPVPNIKIKDYRQANKLQNYNFDYNKASQYVTNDQSLLRLLENTKTKSIMEKKNTSFFSDFKMSRDSNGANRFLFRIDMKEVVTANTIFPDLLESLETKNSKEFKALMNQALITDFKIIRRQVKAEQVISNSGENALFSKYEVPEVVVVSHDDPSGKLLTAQYDESKFYEKNGVNQEEKSLVNAETNAGSISEINVKNYTSPLRNLGKRTFTGVDYGVTSRNGGKFQYAVQLKFVDPVLEYLKKKKNIINSCVASMVPFIEEISSPEYSDMFSNRFNEKAYDFYINNYGENFLSSNIYEFLKALFLTIPDNLEPQQINLDFLVSISHPAVGSIDGLLYLNKLMTDFLQKLEKVINSSMTISKSADFSNNSIGIEPSPYLVEQPNILGSPTQNRLHTIEHNFKDFFDNSITPGFGFDFLSLNMDESFGGQSFGSVGLKTFASNKIARRFNRETEKLFNISSGADGSLVFSLDAKVTGGNAGSEGTKVMLNPSDTISNKKYAYLTPSVVRLPNQGSFDSLSNSSMNNSKLYTLLMTDIYGINQQASGYQNSTKENTYIASNAIDDDMNKEEQMHRLELVSILERKGGSIETKESILKANYSSENENGANKTTPFDKGIKYGFLDTETFKDPLGADNEDNLAIDLIAAALADYKTGVKNLLNTGINTNRLVNSIIMIDDFGMIDKYDTNLGTVFNGIEFYRINTPTGGLTFKQEHFNAYNLSGQLSKVRGQSTPADKLYDDVGKKAGIGNNLGLLGGTQASSQTAQGPGTAGRGYAPSGRGMPTSPGNFIDPSVTPRTNPPASRTVEGPAPYSIGAAGDNMPITIGGSFSPSAISNIAQLVGDSYGSTTEQVFYPLKNAPNHVKALLLYGTSAKKTNILTKANPILESLNNNQDPFRSSDIYAYILMNYKVINKIEVFRGHGHSNCVQQSVFSELTSDDLYTTEYNAGELILCRQTRYLKKAYNVLDIDSIDIPLLDEYFLITPQNISSELVPSSLPDGLLSSLMNTKQVLESYLDQNSGKSAFMGKLLPPAIQISGLGSNPEKNAHERLKERNRIRASGIVTKLTGGKRNPDARKLPPDSKYSNVSRDASRDQVGRSGTRSEPSTSDRREVERTRGGY
jgi:hypothetical protein